MKKLFSILLSLLAFNAYAGTDPKTAFEMSQKDEAVIIDVREKDELKSGMVKDAKWFPLSKVQTDKNWKEDFQKISGGKKIFLYCRTGNRSGKVMDILKANNIESENIGGFETLKNELPIK